MIDTYNRALALREDRKRNSYIERILYNLSSIVSETRNHKLKDKYYEKMMTYIKIEESTGYMGYSRFIVEYMEKEQVICIR